MNKIGIEKAKRLIICSRNFSKKKDIKEKKRKKSIKFSEMNFLAQIIKISKYSFIKHKMNNRGISMSPWPRRVQIF